MLELKDNALQRILPSSISGDATVKDIVQAISGRLAQLGEQAELVLILPRRPFCRTAPAATTICLRSPSRLSRTTRARTHRAA